MQTEILDVGRGAATAGGSVDDTKLTMAELREKAPYYVYRIICGATVNEPWGSKEIEIRSCGVCFRLSYEGWKAIEQTWKRTEKDLKLHGLVSGFNAEDQIHIMASARRLAYFEFGVDPKLLRVLYIRMAENGCTFYRVIQPLLFLQKRAKAGAPLWIEESDYFSVMIGSDYDVIIAPRLSAPGTISMLQYLMSMGKLVIYETDDLLSDIPSWNPNQGLMRAGDQMRREAIIRNANACIVSTEELKEALGRKDVTHVLHNGINPELWPMKPAEQDTECVKVLWAGGETHENDLHLVIKPIINLIKRYGKRVKFVFVGYLPDAFKLIVSVQGKLEPRVHPDFGRSIELVKGCPVFDWAKLLTDQHCHLAIAPLQPCRFNECKSEIKVLEAWALGMPIVASAISPYTRAITPGVDGVLCNPDPQIWEIEIDRLIAKPERRLKMAEAGVKSLESKGYLMNQLGEVAERMLLKVARGKVGRKECSEAVEARLKELGG